MEDLILLFLPLYLFILSFYPDTVRDGGKLKYSTVYNGYLDLFFAGSKKSVWK